MSHVWVSLWQRCRGRLEQPVDSVRASTRGNTSQTHVGGEGCESLQPAGKKSRSGSCPSMFLFKGEMSDQKCNDSPVQVSIVHTNSQTLFSQVLMQITPLRFLWSLTLHNQETLSSSRSTTQKGVELIVSFLLLKWCICMHCKHWNWLALQVRNSVLNSRISVQTSKVEMITSSCVRVSASVWLGDKKRRWGGHYLHVSSNVTGERTHSAKQQTQVLSPSLVVM